MPYSTPALDAPERDEAGRGRAPAAPPTAPTPPRAESSGPAAPGRPAAPRGRRDRVAFWALVLLGLVALSSAAAPLLGPHGGGSIDFGRALEPPSLAHPFGTDDMGRDLFTRVLEGGRASLVVALVAVSLALFIGALAGTASAYAGGVVDALIMRATDFVLSIPVFLVVLLLSSVMSPGLVTIGVLIGLVQWTEVARLVRAVVLSAKEEPFVEAARALGVPGARLVLRHVLVQASGPLGVSASIGFAQAVMFESAVSYLGFGPQPPASSWGSILQNAHHHLGEAPWIAVFPGFMIFATVLCAHVLGDGLRGRLGARRA